jgi:hypothetical protein
VVRPAGKKWMETPEHQRFEIANHFDQPGSDVILVRDKKNMQTLTMDC